MIKDIDIQTACNIILDFAQANQVDVLTGMELMVKHYKILSAAERQALVEFMAETAKKA